MYIKPKRIAALPSSIAKFFLFLAMKSRHWSSDSGSWYRFITYSPYYMVLTMRYLIIIALTMITTAIQRIFNIQRMIQIKAAIANNNKRINKYTRIPFYWRKNPKVVLRIVRLIWWKINHFMIANGQNTRSIKVKNQPPWIVYPIIAVNTDSMKYTTLIILFISVFSFQIRIDPC